MKTRLIPITVLIFITATPVLAGPGYGQGGKGKFMSFFDSNEDGVVTMEEFKESSAARFDNMDADHNTTVTQDEFSGYVGQRREQHRQHRFESIDTNKDGQLSKDEFAAYSRQKALRRFAGMDSNSDGLISTEEYTTRKYGKHGSHNGHHHGHSRGHGFFNRLDTNKDGQLTRDESLAAWTTWFKRIDTNGDQVVTAEEVQNYRNNMHGN
jgi:Ca2+-binding EF-hand superfamily protein